MAPLDAAQISLQLAAKIQTLVADLFPAGKREAFEWKIGSLGGEQGRSLSICLRGPKAGIWGDFATGQRGDALDLVAHALYRGDLSLALSWAKQWLGVASGEAVEAPRRHALIPKISQGTSNTTAVAEKLWQEARPAANSIVETYLKSRGLTLPDVECLRFHPSCPHGPGIRFPVMMALMTDPITGKPIGIHRTPLLPDGSGRPPNAEKKMLGGAGVIRLSDDAEVSTGLGIAEGIETSLAVMQRAGWRPVWAAGTAGGMARFPMLPGIECLTIFADHDLPKPDGKQPGIDAARACAGRWSAAGREVIIQKPPLGCDWLDAFGRAA